MENRSWLSLAAVATTLVSWASAFVAIRHLGSTVPAGALTIGRLGVAVLALAVMLAVQVRRTGRPPRWPARRQWPLMVLCGVSWFGVYNLTLNEGERYVDAGTAAMLIQLGPLLVALLAAMFLGEPLTGWTVCGVAVGFAGVVLIGTSSDAGGQRSLLGVGLVLLAALTYAVGVVSQKPLTATGGPLEITLLACLVGLATASPWLGQLIDLARHGSPAEWGWIVYLGVVPTALAFSTWAYALSRMGAARLSITTFLVPVIAIALGALLLDETPPPIAYLGGALCVAGVLLSRRKQRVAKVAPASVTARDPVGPQQ